MTNQHLIKLILLRELFSSFDCLFKCLIGVIIAPTFLYAIVEYYFMFLASHLDWSNFISKIFKNSLNFSTIS